MINKKAQLSLGKTRYSICSSFCSSWPSKFDFHVIWKVVQYVTFY